MVEGQTYTYAVKYRNGDGVETATTTMGGVSFTRDNGGGGTPTIQPQTTVSTSSQQATTTSATSTQISQIKAQILEIQQKLIILISQLIQLLQGQLNQL